MPSERQIALVIGNDTYDWTGSLANACKDARAVAQALVRFGFEVIEAYDAEKRVLEGAIREFGNDLETASVGLVFYAGHGLRVGRKNYIVPKDANLQREKHLSLEAISLSAIQDQLRRENVAGIILLDACRDNPLTRSAVAAGGARWSIGGFAKMSSTDGCCIAFSTGPGRKADDGHDEHSPFTSALLAELERDNVELSDVLSAISERVKQATGGKQEPWFDNRLVRPYFFRRREMREEDSDPYASLDALDPRVQLGSPAVLDCVVVMAELPPEISDLDRQVRLALDNYEPEIIEAATTWRRHWQRPAQSTLETGASSTLAVRRLKIEADRAFESPETLKAAIRALCLADIAVFDVTRWQPGVMLLLGVRSVARRGLTICSYGDHYVHGETLALPFNLQGLNIAAHSANQEGKQLGPEHIIGSKIINGLEEIASRPGYLDLPAYDAVRNLGADFHQFDPIPRRARALILCPFGDRYAANWHVLRRELNAQLNRGRAPDETRRREDSDKPRATQLARDFLVRVLDVETPRLVTQQLYELMRRVDMCVVDWTELRPDVMFELGVRLAVNPLGAVHIGETGRLKHVPLGMDQPSADNLSQIEHLLRRFAVMEYSRNQPRPLSFQRMLARFDEGLRARETGNDEYRKTREMDFLVYETVGQTLALEPGSIAAPLLEELVASAKLMTSEEEDSTGRSSVLHHDVSVQLRREAHRSAFERRLAAWLLIDARHTNDEVAAEPGLLAQFRSLAAQVQLYFNRQRDTQGASMLDDRDASLNKRISERMTGLRRSQVMADVALIKAEAKLLRDRQDFAGAIELLREGVEVIARSGWDEGLRAGRKPSDAQRKMAWHLADCYGMIGGNQRRSGDLAGAIQSFDLGQPLEEDEQLRVSSSYNTVNAIVARIERGDKGAASQHQALRRAAAIVERKISDPEMSEDARRGDRWAWADLGLCRLLSGDEEGAYAAYQRSAELGDSASLLSSMGVLRSIAQKLEASGDPASALARKGIAFLDQQRQRIGSSR